MKINFPLIFLGLIIAVATSGCYSSKQPQSEKTITYRYNKSDHSSIVRFRGHLESSVNHNVSIHQYAGGKLEMLAPEGELIASGALIAQVGMQELEKYADDLDRYFNSIDKNLEDLEIRNPLEMEQVRFAADNARRKQDAAIEENKWLKEGRSKKTYLKAQADLQKSEIELYFAQKLLKMQKNVTEKGFDSPFALSRQQIETEAHKATMDHARRWLTSIKEGPLPEEYARVQHLIQVASGEAVIATDEVNAASISYQIRRQSQIATRKAVRAQTRIFSDILNSRIIKAPASGTVIYPVTPRGEKTSLGQHVHGGWPFLQVVDANQLVLEAAVTENFSSLLTTGAKAKIVFDAHPNITLDGEVTHVSRSPTPVSPGSDYMLFPVKIDILAQKVPLVIGMKASVKIEVASSTGIFIPRDLLLSENNENKLLYVSANRTISTFTAEIESFDSDFIKWLNPPTESGELAYW